VLPHTKKEQKTDNQELTAIYRTV